MVRGAQSSAAELLSCSPFVPNCPPTFLSSELEVTLRLFTPLQQPGPHFWFLTPQFEYMAPWVYAVTYKPAKMMLCCYRGWWLKSCLFNSNEREWNLIFITPEKQALHTEAHPLNDPLILSFTPHIPTDRNSNIFTLSLFNTTYLLCSPRRPQWTPSACFTYFPWCLFFVLIKQTYYPF